MISKINDWIYKLSFSNFGSNVYILLISGKKIMIDTSSRECREELLSDLDKLKIKPIDIDVVLLTHWHFDHFENLSLFSNADIYISQKEIDTFKLNNTDFSFNPLPKEIFGLKVINTSGHTSGSVCFVFEDFLFSGDTLFDNGFGRTDLYSGNMDELRKSLKLLGKTRYSRLLPGH